MKKYCSLVLSLRAMYATAQDAVATLQNDMICKNRGQFSNIKSACRKNVSRQREITLNGDILRFADIRTTDIRQMRKPFK
ncbi:MAG: hypothetical protein LBR36_08515, partial [Bacteroidales bacterium]|nr:hypothetical protein [Bacteroidales bacterium]